MKAANEMLGNTQSNMPEIHKVCKISIKEFLSLFHLDGKKGHLFLCLILLGLLNQCNS
jgi:hypothetical protein